MSEQTQPTGSEQGTSFNPFGAADQAGHAIPSNEPTTSPQTPAPQTPAAQPSGSPQQPTVPASSPATAQPTVPGAVPPTGQQQTPPVVPGVALSPEQFQQLLQTVQPGQGQQQQQQVQERPLTQQEIEERYAVARVTEEEVATVFRGGKEGAEALTNLLHKAAKMGATIAAHHSNNNINQLYQHLQGQIAPAQRVAQQTEQEYHRQAFFREYNGFTEADTPVLMSVYDRLLNSGFRGTPAQVYEKVATEATNLIRNYKPGFNPKAGQAAGTPGQPGSAAPQVQQTQPGGQMAQLVTSSGPGAGTPQQTLGDGSPGDTAKSVFGRLG